MEIKKLEQYPDRELLELIVSNQVRMEQRLYKIYWFLADEHGENFHKHNQHKGEVMKEFLNSYRQLNKQINQIIEEEKE